jgi:hypothetical protein
MAKKKPPMGWMLSTPKKAKAPLPESTKTDLDAKARKLVEEVLKPRYAQPPPTDAMFNYLASYTWMPTARKSRPVGKGFSILNGWTQT